MKDLHDWWDDLFSPCYCVPIREAAAKLVDAADGRPTQFLSLGGKPLTARDVEVNCPHCKDTKVIPTAAGREFLRVLLLHLKKLNEKPEIPF